MSNREELYGWKGLRQLFALCLFQGLLGSLFAVELWRSDAAGWSSLSLVTLAGGAFLLVWHWRLLVPTLVRFDLVFMPMLERRVLLPSFAAMGALALGAACWPAVLSSVALKLIAVLVLALSLLCFAVAWFLASLLRGERATLADMQRHYRQFEVGKSRAELSRIERFLEQRAQCPSPGLPIRGIEFPGLTSRPWHEPSSLSWITRLEEAYPMIRDEISSALAQPTAGLKQYRYLGVSTSDWQSLMLFCEPNGFLADNCAKLPKTAALLRSLPVIFGREVMVSVLKPRSRIPAHRDSGNLTLTCQLGVRIPTSGCSIRVGREQRTWTAGKCIVFDTTYEHEVSNDSDEMRVVLLFDFLHPDLTVTERAFFEQWARSQHEPADVAPAVLDVA